MNIYIAAAPASLAAACLPGQLILQQAGQDDEVVLVGVQAVDMWSLGCILHILLCGKVPFSSFNSAIQDRKIIEGAWDTKSKVI